MLELLSDFLSSDSGAFDCESINSKSESSEGAYLDLCLASDDRKVCFRFFDMISRFLCF